jgi:hypothetical protein
MAVRNMPTAELIAELRRAAAVWFRNDHLLLLEELIRRVPTNAPDMSGSNLSGGAP